MSTLSRENRRLLENTVAQARAIAEEGARKVLQDQYAVHHYEPWPHMTAGDRMLRNQLRAHGRQLGDRRDPKRETQEIRHLAQACAYEHWHRMLFARFLAENGFLLDAQYGVAITLDDIRELAREQSRDWIDIASEFAQRMLLAVFSPEDPVLKIDLAPETRQELEKKLGALPREIFQADDSLGWVYQFWQRDEKDRVNRSEVKIGADELPAVTQLFTEDYMVLFLLENTLGAWWTAKRRAEGKNPNLPGYEWKYLRLNEDGSPAAGAFERWPRTVRHIRLLDPSMGSGHFLVFAMPILARMRMDEEGLSLQGALSAVLKENLFGLEIDARCSQIAAFNLALAAWRLAGEHFQLPKLQIACSGLGPNCTKEQWMKLAEEVAARGGMPAKSNLFGSEDSLLSEPARNAMEALHELFSQAPLLGSLIDPAHLRGHLFEANYPAVEKLFENVISAQTADENTRERLIAAAGMAQAAALLGGKYTLITTNVPYLGRGKQSPALAEYCENHHPDAKADLATCFVDRCLRFCSDSASIALVTPQNWLFLTSYKTLRKRLLTSFTWNFIARLGPNSFETVSGEVVNVSLMTVTCTSPTLNSTFAGWDVSQSQSPSQKAEHLTSSTFTSGKQAAQLQNPDARLMLVESSAMPILSKYAEASHGQGTFDNARFCACFWELDAIRNGWVPQQSTPVSSMLFGGCHYVLRWEKGEGAIAELMQLKEDAGYTSGKWKAGINQWNKRGVLVGQMGEFPATLYLGWAFDENASTIIPKDPDDLPAIWSFVQSEDFRNAIIAIDQSIKITCKTLVKVPFDLTKWRKQASDEYAEGLPKPESSDPAQWIFDGGPATSDNPLHVSVARLMNYRWPRQNGSHFIDCPALSLDGLERHAASDGIVPLSAIAGEASASDRLRALLADAFGNKWSAAMLQQLLGNWQSLEEWLRDGFFEEHCRIFLQRPFIWHVWDGRKDGFHALINYHKLASPNGLGRNTLERLIYTYLGRWIERQSDEVRAGKEGADARLTAATHLRTELESILKGENPYDIFVRWKPIHDQPAGWEPDINDGVRLNIRPWLTAKVHQPSRRDGCILRVTPKIPFGKDRGKEPHRSKEDFPWFWTWDQHSDDFMGDNEFDGVRWNELHYSLAKKKAARGKQKTEVAVSAKRNAWL